MPRCLRGGVTIASVVCGVSSAESRSSSHGDGRQSTAKVGVLGDCDARFFIVDDDDAIGHVEVVATLAQEVVEDGSWLCGQQRGGWEEGRCVGKQRFAPLPA